MKPEENVIKRLAFVKYLYKLDFGQAETAGHRQIG